MLNTTASLYQPLRRGDRIDFAALAVYLEARARTAQAARDASFGERRVAYAKSAARWFARASTVRRLAGEGPA